MYSLDEVDVGLNELSTTSTTTTSGIDNPDNPMTIKTGKEFGIPCIEVDDETYSNCIKGKVPFKKWKNYTNDKNLENEMKNMYKKNNKLIVKNSKDGMMSFVK